MVKQRKKTNKLRNKEIYEFFEKLKALCDEYKVNSMPDYGERGVSVYFDNYDETYTFSYNDRYYDPDTDGYKTALSISEHYSTYKFID